MRSPAQCLLPTPAWKHPGAAGRQDGGGGLHLRDQQGHHGHHHPGQRSLPCQVVSGVEKIDEKVLNVFSSFKQLQPARVGRDGEPVRVLYQEGPVQAQVFPPLPDPAVRDDHRVS